MELRWGDYRFHPCGYYVEEPGNKYTYIHTCIYICLHFHCERYIILKKALMNLFMNSDELND